MMFALLALGLVSANRASALTYQEWVDVRFTFNSSIVLNLSSENLTIYNLIPGTASDSNVINVTATSNNPTGYVITATVGNSTHTAPSYNNTSLNHASTNDSFTCLATNANVALNSITDDYWGYSVSTNNGSSWSNYSGLPLYTASSGKEIFSTNSNGTNTINFKIGARASASQPSGEYTNVINFTVTANAVPMDDISDLTYMQDFAGLTSSQRNSVVGSMALDTQYQLIDKRDGKSYYIAKLRDDNVWMTQNLDLNIDSGTTYTNEDTDIGYNTSTYEYDTASWTPVRSTYSATANQTRQWCNGNTWNNGCSLNYTPESYDPGNLYWNTLAGEETYIDWDNYSCNYSTNPPTCDQSLNPISTYTSNTGTPQYHLGNYYNSAAALAMNDTSSVAWGALVDQSICPSGWTLPESSYGSIYYSYKSFGNLWGLYGWNVSDQYGDNVSITELGSPLYYPLSGFFDGALLYVGDQVLFRESVKSGYASGIQQNHEGWDTTLNVNPHMYEVPDSHGLTVRCILRYLGDSPPA